MNKLICKENNFFVYIIGLTIWKRERQHLIMFRHSSISSNIALMGIHTNNNILFKLSVGSCA